MIDLAKLDLMLPIWMARTHQRRRLTRAVLNSYSQWRRRFPRWANAGFDEYFLLHNALPILSEMLAGGSTDAVRLARLWVAAYGIPTPRRGRAVAAVTPVAAEFLGLLQQEYTALHLA
jgi:hypothetical protein